MNAKELKHNYSLARWAALLKECKESGLQVKEWLAQNNIPKDAYYYWKRELQKAYVKEVAPTFVALPVQQPSTQVAQVVQHETSQPAPAAVVRLGSSTIELYDGASESFLRTVLEAVSHAQ